MQSSQAASLPGPGEKTAAGTRSAAWSCARDVGSEAGPGLGAADGSLPAAFGFLSCCSSLNQAAETASSAQSSTVPLAFLLQAGN